MPYTLLLADDSVTIQRVIELTFADEEIQVIAVGDGREAIRRIEADRPDIVLADVGMPEKDGYQVAAHVKNTPHLSHIPVLLLTGAFEPVDEQRAQEVGCDGVLAKPFEPQMVITRVKELLDAAPQPRAATAPPATGERPAAPEPPPTVEPVSAASPTAAPFVAPPPAPPGSPLDAFLAAAPEPDLAAYDGLPSASERSRPVVPDPVPSGDADSRAEWGDEAIPNTDGRTAPPEVEVLSSDSSAVRISRRAPIAVPGFGAPSLPPVSTAAELDDYFEKLDAAFASLQQTPFRAESADLAPAFAGESAPSSRSPEPLQMSSRWLSPPTDQSPILSGTESQPTEHAPAIAQAFSALLAAEHGQTTPPPASAAAGANALSPEAIDQLVDRVAREVLEQMSERVVRDTVTDIVSRIAERLVREEIDRVKATIK